MPVEALATFPSLYEITEWGKGARSIRMDKKRKDKSGSGLDQNHSGNFPI
jgi:hypothetical protein